MVHEVYLVGVGLGNPGTLTVQARETIESSDLLIGAPRLVDAFAGCACEKLRLIRSDDIVAALNASEAQRASVLFSGDVGFYSGATALAQKLATAGGFDVQAIPGISSLVYFCAKLLTPWQDAHLVSAHGRACDPAAEVATHAKTFLLTGGKTKVADVCRQLVDAGLGDVTVAVGERLSYDDERITSGSACELRGRSFDDLAVMLVGNDAVPACEPGKLES